MIYPITYSNQRYPMSSPYDKLPPVNAVTGIKAVTAQEKEYVSYAITKANKENNELVNVSDSFKMAVFPEYRTPYISSSLVTSQIRYNESNPYEQIRKESEGSILKGLFVDYVA